MYRLFGIVLLALATSISACSGSKQNKQKYQTPQEAFEKGIALYEKKRYTDAIEFFKGVFDFGRTNEWADDAQYYLGLSYMGSKDYMVAEQELMRFVSLYRSDPRSIEAEFQRLICYYRLSPTFELDQTDTDRALTNMNIFLQRYPNDDRSSQISLMIKELREKLGQKAYEAGKTYERRGYYQAAAHTFEQVLQSYADTSWADNALLGAIRSYVLYAKNSVESKQAERFDKAITTYNRLVELYPKSEVLKMAEVLYMEATALKSAIKPKS